MSLEAVGWARPCNIEVSAGSNGNVSLTVPESLNTLEKTNAVLHEFGSMVANEYRNNPDKIFAAPANGGVLPTLYSIEAMIHSGMAEGEVQRFVQDLVWLGYGPGGEYYTDRPNVLGSSLGRTVNVIDDIYDSGKTHDKTKRLFGTQDVTLFAASIKMTPGNIQAIEQEGLRQVAFPRNGQLPNEWIEGGFGMNRGLKIFDQTKVPDPASIAAMQRVFAYPYYNSNYVRQSHDRTFDYSQEADFLNDQSNYCDLAQMHHAKESIPLAIEDLTQVCSAIVELHDEALLYGDNAPTVDAYGHVELNIVGLLSVLEVLNRRGKAGEDTMASRFNLVKGFMSNFVAKLYRNPSSVFA